MRTDRCLCIGQRRLSRRACGRSPSPRPRSRRTPASAQTASQTASQDHKTTSLRPSQACEKCTHAPVARVVVDGAAHPGVELRVLLVAGRRVHKVLGVRSGHGRKLVDDLAVAPVRRVASLRPQRRVGVRVGPVALVVPRLQLRVPNLLLRRRRAFSLYKIRPGAGERGERLALTQTEQTSPPQSTPVSSPLSTPSKHVGHGSHEPPQSSSSSSPLRIWSTQLAHGNLRPQ